MAHSEMPFVCQHLKVLRGIPLTPQGRVGGKVRPWAESLKFTPPETGIPQEILNQLPTCALDRVELRIFCQTADIPAGFLAVSAWGGMDRRYAALAWKAKARWEPSLAKIQPSNNSRGHGYDLLQKLRLKGGFPGVGIAYFTKLLFFLRPIDDAYIMDQWTAKSVNLLTGRNIVKMSGGWVVDANDRTCYEEFCGVVDQLACCLKTDRSSAEQALMSEGGHRPGPWRRYVKEHYPRQMPDAVGKR